MGPGHRQNGGRRQERHLDAAGAQLMSTSVGGADLAGWCWCGGGLASWWGLSGAGGDSVGPKIYKPNARGGAGRCRKARWMAASRACL
jgi:hypothetical protein